MKVTTQRILERAAIAAGIAVFWLGIAHSGTWWFAVLSIGVLASLVWATLARVKRFRDAMDEEKRKLGASSAPPNEREG